MDLPQGGRSTQLARFHRSLALSAAEEPANEPNAKASVKAEADAIATRTRRRARLEPQTDRSDGEDGTAELALMKTEDEEMLDELDELPSVDELLAEIADDIVLTSATDGGDASLEPAPTDAGSSFSDGLRGEDKHAQESGAAAGDSLPPSAVRQAASLLPRRVSAIVGDEDGPPTGAKSGGWASPVPALDINDLLACFDDDDDDDEEKEKENSDTNQGLTALTVDDEVNENGDKQNHGPTVLIVEEEKEKGEKRQWPTTVTIEEEEKENDDKDHGPPTLTVEKESDRSDKSDKSDEGGVSDECDVTALECEAKRGESPPPRRMWRREGMPFAAPPASYTFTGAGRRRVGEQTKKRPLGSLVALPASQLRESAGKALDAHDATAVDSPSVLQCSCVASDDVRASDVFCSSEWLAGGLRQLLGTSGEASMALCEPAKWRE